jgi:hypothetical protein
VNNDQRCKSCKHWGGSDRGGMAVCDRITYQGDRNPDGVTPRAYDSEWLNAEFHTPPGFGCVLWEANPAPTDDIP